MKNKRVLVLGVALVLFASVVGAVFAQSHRGNLQGVVWAAIKQDGSYSTEIYNGNDYAVRVNVQCQNVKMSGDYDFAARQNKHFASQCRVSRVERR